MLRMRDPRRVLQARLSPFTRSVRLAHTPSPPAPLDLSRATFLVTGGNGCCGSSILDLLRSYFPHSRRFSLSRSLPSSAVAIPDTTYLSADVSSLSSLGTAFETVQPDVVFHVAGLMVGAAPGVFPDQMMRDVNVGGTRNVLDLAKTARTRAVVYTSSAGVVQKQGRGWDDIAGGDETLPVIQDEDGCPIYWTTKSAAEKLVLAADSPSGLRTVALRPACLYGERDTANIQPNLDFYSRGADRGRLQVGDNTNKISVTYGYNSAWAHIEAARRLVGSTVELPSPAVFPGWADKPSDTETATTPARHGPEGIAGEAFNISDGPPVAYWDFCRLMWRHAGYHVPAEHELRVLTKEQGERKARRDAWVAWAMGKQPAVGKMFAWMTTASRWYVTTKVEERLGYRPKVSTEEGVRRGVRWYLEHQAKA